MLTIKRNNKKQPIIKFNHQKFVGFKLTDLPKRFASIESEEPIQNWFNHKGFTFINADLI